MEKSIIKGIAVPAAAVALSKLFLIVDWFGFGAVMYIYFPLTAVSAAIIITAAAARRKGVRGN